jgi:hypothetical protein
MARAQVTTKFYKTKVPAVKECTTDVCSCRSLTDHTPFYRIVRVWIRAGNSKLILELEAEEARDLAWKLEQAAHEAVLANSRSSQRKP